MRDARLRAHRSPKQNRMECPDLYLICVNVAKVMLRDGIAIIPVKRKQMTSYERLRFIRLTPNRVQLRQQHSFYCLTRDRIGRKLA